MSRLGSGREARGPDSSGVAPPSPVGSVGSRSHMTRRLNVTLPPSKDPAGARSKKLAGRAASPLAGTPENSTTEFQWEEDEQAASSPDSPGARAAQEALLRDRSLRRRKLSTLSSVFYQYDDQELGSEHSGDSPKPQGRSDIFVDAPAVLPAFEKKPSKVWTSQDGMLQRVPTQTQSIRRASVSVASMSKSAHSWNYNGMALLGMTGPQSDQFRDFLNRSDDTRASDALLPFVTQHLNTLPIFGSLSKSDQEAVYRRLQHQIALKDELVLKEGDVSDRVYIVLGGKLEMVVTKGTRKETMATLTAGNSFGSRMVGGHGTCHAVIRVVSPTAEFATLSARHMNALTAQGISLGGVDVDYLNDLRSLLKVAPHQRDADQVRRISEFTGHLPFFRDMNGLVAGHCSKVMQYLRAEVGEVLLKEGDPGTCFYILLTGNLAVHMEARAKRMASMGLVPYQTPENVSSILKSKVQVGSYSSWSTARKTLQVGGGQWRKRETHDVELNIDRILLPGTAFGEKALVGTNDLRSSSVIASDIVELVVLDRAGYKMVQTLGASHKANPALNQLTRLLLSPPAARSEAERGAMLEVLADMPFFTKFSAKTQKELVKHIQYRLLAPDEVVFEQGDVGDKFYIVLAGNLSVLAKTGSTTAMEVGRLSPWESFGEMALTSGSKNTRTATVKCLEMAELAVVDAAVYRSIMAKEHKRSRAKENESLVLFLRQVSLLQGFPEKILNHLAALFWLDKVPKGTVVLRSGAVAEKLYVVQEGAVCVLWDPHQPLHRAPPEIDPEIAALLPAPPPAAAPPPGADPAGEKREPERRVGGGGGRARGALKKEAQLCVIGKGDWFGDMSVIAGRQEHLTFVAHTDVALLTVARVQLVEVLGPPQLQDCQEWVAMKDRFRRQRMDFCMDLIAPPEGAHPGPAPPVADGQPSGAGLHSPSIAHTTPGASQPVLALPAPSPSMESIAAPPLELVPTPRSPLKQSPAPQRGTIGSMLFSSLLSAENPHVAPKVNKHPTRKWPQRPEDQIWTPESPHRRSATPRGPHRFSHRRPATEGMVHVQWSPQQSPPRSTSPSLRTPAQRPHSAARPLTPSSHAHSQHRPFTPPATSSHAYSSLQNTAHASTPRSHGGRHSVSPSPDRSPARTASGARHPASRSVEVRSTSTSSPWQAGRSPMFAGGQTPAVPPIVSSRPASSHVHRPGPKNKDAIDEIAKQKEMDRKTIVLAEFYHQRHDGEIRRYVASTLESAADAGQVDKEQTPWKLSVPAESVSEASASNHDPASPYLSHGVSPGRAYRMNENTEQATGIGEGEGRGHAALVGRGAEERGEEAEEAAGPPPLPPRDILIASVNLAEGAPPLELAPQDSTPQKGSSLTPKAEQLGEQPPSVPKSALHPSIRWRLRNMDLAPSVQAKQPSFERLSASHAKREERKLALNSASPEVSRESSTDQVTTSIRFGINTSTKKTPEAGAEGGPNAQNLPTRLASGMFNPVMEESFWAGGGRELGLKPGLELSASWNPLIMKQTDILPKKHIKVQSERRTTMYDGWIPAEEAVEAALAPKAESDAGKVKMMFPVFNAQPLSLAAKRYTG